MFASDFWIDPTLLSGLTNSDFQIHMLRAFMTLATTVNTLFGTIQLGLSVSTTHCLIGAITGVALVEGSAGVNKDTIQKIVLSWVITVPASAVLGVICISIWRQARASGIFISPKMSSDLVNINTDMP